MWDNLAVQHYASSDYWPEIRIMERASRCIALFDGQITYDGPADRETMHKLLP